MYRYLSRIYFGAQIQMIQLQLDVAKELSDRGKMRTTLRNLNQDGKEEFTELSVNLKSAKRELEAYNA